MLFRSDLGNRLKHAGARLPAIFCVNWFRTDENGRFVWPGFGENMRVLAWMLGRIEGKADGVEHVFGMSPGYDDLHWKGLEFSREAYSKITSIDRDAWRTELELHAELFAQLAHGLPKTLLRVKETLERKLAA